MGRGPDFNVGFEQELDPVIFQTEKWYKFVFSQIKDVSLNKTNDLSLFSPILTRMAIIISL